VINLAFTGAEIMNALMIFGLRVVGMSLDTIRVLFVMRGKKSYAWVLGFIQAAVYIVAITSVLSNLGNWLNVLGYAGGFATGNVVGMWLDDKMAVGHSHVRIISSTLGSAIADKLRQDGFAVTELPARGRDGVVTMLTCNVLRKRVNAVRDIARKIDDDAFITAEDIRPVRRGFWRP